MYYTTRFAGKLPSSCTIGNKSSQESASSSVRSSLRAVALSERAGWPGVIRRLTRVINTLAWVSKLPYSSFRSLNSHLSNNRKSVLSFSRLETQLISVISKIDIVMKTKQKTMLRQLSLFWFQSRYNGQLEGISLTLLEITFLQKNWIKNLVLTVRTDPNQVITECTATQTIKGSTKAMCHRHQSLRYKVLRNIIMVNHCLDIKPWSVAGNV